jgi:hypothetical protein
MPRMAWGLAVLVALAHPALAQFEPLAPTGGPPPSPSAPIAPAAPVAPLRPEPPAGESTGQLPPEPDPARATAPASIPNILGAPVRPAGSASSSLPPAERAESPPTDAITPTSYPEPPPRRAVRLGAPDATGRPLPAERIEPAAQPRYTPPAVDPVDELLTRRQHDRRTPGRPGAEERAAGKFGEKIADTLTSVFGNTTDWFKSDHCFDGFISPVTNPFLFEDPRSLTEARPIFLYQNIPSKEPNFQGGNIWFFGLQGRVAFTDRLSLTINKLGGISINPSSNSVYPGETGFAELWLGGKYTIIRSEETGSLLAGGLQFQIPVGSSGAFQNTGSLSLVPWVSYAQNFGRDLRIGSFNAILGTGYSASVNTQRSSYYWLSAHLDLDLWNNHKFYPLTELNWYLMTTNGSTAPFTTEGRDLFNFGAQASGQGLLTWAFGARYKISESAQFGGAFEFPLAGPKGLFNYRFTLDFILRY